MINGYSIKTERKANLDVLIKSKRDILRYDEYNFKVFGINWYNRPLNILYDTSLHSEVPKFRNRINKSSDAAIAIDGIQTEKNILKLLGNAQL